MMESTMEEMDAMMAVSGKPDTVFSVSAFLRRRIIMAAGCWFAKGIGAIGITAAVVVLLTAFTGFLVLRYGINHLHEWDENRSLQ